MAAITESTPLMLTTHPTGGSVEVGPVVDWNGHIFEAIDRRVILGEGVSERCGRKAARLGLQFFVVAFNGFAQLSFIPPNMAFGGKDVVLGGTLAVCEGISFWGLQSWAVRAVIREYMEALTPAEAALLRSQMGRAKRGVILAASVGIGLLSQIPPAYIVQHYNPDKVYYPVIVLISEACLPTRSLQLSFEKAATVRGLTPLQKQINKVRTRMVELVEGNRAFFEQMDREQKGDYLARYERIKAILQRPDRFREFMTLMLKDHPEMLAEDPTGIKALRYLVGFGGVTLTASQMTMLGFLAYAGAGLFIASPVGCGALAVGVVGSSLYLCGKSIIGSNIRSFDALCHLFTGKYQRSHAEQMRPKLTFALKAVSTLIACLSWGSTAEATRATIPGGFGTFIEVMSSIALVFLISTALLDLVNEIVETLVITRGSEEERSILALNAQIKHLIRLLEESPFVQIARLLRALPQDVWEELVAGTKVTAAALDEMIAAEPRPAIEPPVSRGRDAEMQSPV